MDFYDLAGKVSAATLGFIVGDIPGAYTGYNLYNSFQKRMVMKRKASGSVARPAKKLRGPVGSVPMPFKPRWGKRKPRACKGVRVPKKLAKQIRCVAMKQIHGEKPTGKYFKNINGVITKTAGSSEGQSVTSKFAYTGTTVGDLTCFSVGDYKKIIDAASVLFSTKTAAVLYSTVDIISAAQCVIPAFYHIQRIELRNNGPLMREITLYETVPREDTSNSVSSNWALMTLTQKGGATQNYLYYGMRPEMYPQFRDGYRILKKKTVRLGPGRSTYYTLVQRSDHIKFDDWAIQGSATINTYRKGFSKELLVIDAQPAAGVTIGAAASAVAWNSSSDSVQSFLAVFSKELITMKCPETVDNINQKDNTICVLNSSYSQLYDGTSNTYVVPAISTPAVYY